MSVSIKNMTKRFGSKRVLNDISIDIKSGEIFALIGPNGAGKTTTLRTIFGEIKPDTGEVNVFGKALSSKVKEKMTVMPEERLTFSRFTGEDYHDLWSKLYPGWNEKIFSSFANHFNFNLEDKVSTYSMGMKTLLNLALCMSANSDLMLLDEPTQNLDPVIRSEILKVIKNYIEDQENKTIIISSHEIYELEEVATSFAIIKEGEILYADTIDSSKEKHRIINSGEKIPAGEVVGIIENETLIRTTEDVGRYPNFKEIVLGYLQGKKEFIPFQKRII